MSRTYESPRRAAQAAETRRKILRALVDLLTEERAAVVSVPQVAERAGVSVRIVYHHFPSKDALFDGLLDHLPELMVRPPPEIEPARTPEALADAMGEAYAYLAANQALFRAIALSEVAPKLQARRTPARAERVDTALSELLSTLPPAEATRVRTICGMLASFEGFEALTLTWGLSVEDAAEVAAWTVRTVCAEARRHVTDPEGRT